MISIYPTYRISGWTLRLVKNFGVWGMPELAILTMVGIGLVIWSVATAGGLFMLAYFIVWFIKLIIGDNERNDIDQSG